MRYQTALHPDATVSILSKKSRIVKRFVKIFLIYFYILTKQNRLRKTQSPQSEKYQIILRPFEGVVVKIYVILC